jgi:histidyl-tRNA synthetase
VTTLAMPASATRTRNTKTNRRATENAGVTRVITKGLEVALYYGFSPRPAPKISRDDIDKARKIQSAEPIWKVAGDDGSCFLCESPEEKIAILRTFEEEKMAEWPQPVMLAFEGPLRGGRGEKYSPKEFHLDLEIIGTNKTIAEAILAKTAYEILREEGFTDLYLDVNSVGDRDSMARFGREIVTYYKKHAHELSPKCREAIKKDPVGLSCSDERCNMLHVQAPQPLAHLSEPSREHFREVLEYLESTNLPYRINPNLLGDRAICTHTIFEIKSLSAEGKDTPPLAFGVRYNGLAKKIGFKKDVPAVGVSIVFKKTNDHGRRAPVLLRKPKVFFIQLGFEAKLKSLTVIEALRQANIPIVQSLPKDKLGAQLSAAETMQIPYTIIFGQKEALDGTVIIRNMTNRSQDIVRIGELPTYLKKVR